MCGTHCHRNPEKQKISESSGRLKKLRENIVGYPIHEDQIQLTKAPNCKLDAGRVTEGSIVCRYSVFTLLKANVYGLCCRWDFGGRSGLQSSPAQTVEDGPALDMCQIYYQRRRCLISVMIGEQI